MQEKERIRYLVSELNRHRKLYFQDMNHEISDAEYDRLFHELVALEQKTGTCFIESPTQTVGYKTVGGASKITHAQPLKSLSNSFSAEDTRAFDRRAKNILGLRMDEKLSMVCNCKWDGAALNLGYVDGIFRYAATRGDGIIGEDVSDVVERFVKNIPMRLSGPDIPPLVEIRGEALLSFAAFEAINRERVAAGEEPFKTPRNAAAGSLRVLNGNADRGLEFVPYNVAGVDGMFTEYTGLFDWFRAQGFAVPWQPVLVADVEEAIKEAERIERLRNENMFNVDIDGAVLTYQDMRLHPILSSTAKDPRFSLAVKFPAPTVKTRLLSVTCQIGRSSAITPVGELEPVMISGVRVSRVTLSNFQLCAEKDIRVSDFLIVRRAGEVIPEVVSVVLEERPADAKPILPPTECPACGGSVFQAEGEVAVRCTNINCEGQAIERIAYFAGRSALNIVGLGPKLVRVLFVNGLVKHFTDIFELKKEDLLGLAKFQDKSAQNLIDAIAKSRDTTLTRFLVGLCIPQVGEQTAKLLASHFPDLEALCRAASADFVRLKDVGDKTAKEIAAFFNNPDNLMALNKIGQLGLKLSNPGYREGAANGSLTGKTVVITGTMEAPRDAVKALIEQAGGKVSSSVSRKTDFVVVGADPGSKLTNAQALGVKVITYPELAAMTGQ